MGLKNDRWIISQSTEWVKTQGAQPMIFPFVEKQVKKDALDNPVISYGTSSYGYDLRLHDEYKVFTNVNNAVVDPKNFSSDSFVEVKKDVLIIPPNSFALARSVEYFRIPRGVAAIVLGKSTYARCGIIANFTPIEPEWEGFLTIEISNTTPSPAMIYSFEGFAQMIFFEADEVCEISYADRKGKYQAQTGVTGARV